MLRLEDSLLASYPVHDPRFVLFSARHPTFAENEKLVTAYFVCQIWNRLIASVFNVRDLNIHESIALVLAICLLAN